MLGFMQRLKAYRLKCSFGKRAFANSIGILPSRYDRIERGVEGPTEEELTLLESLVDHDSSFWLKTSLSTDIDRLHRVVATLPAGLGRGCGKTFARCHELCGTLEVGRLDAVAGLLRRRAHLDFILPMLDQVLDEHRISYVMENGKRKGSRYVRAYVHVPDCGEKSIHWFWVYDKREPWRGINCHYVDFDY